MPEKHKIQLRELGEMETIKRIVQTSVLLCLCSGNVIGAGNHSHEQVSNEAEYFAKEALKKEKKREAKHSKKLVKGYKSRHDVIVDLSAINLSVDENMDFSMEELDQIYQYIYDRLPPQRDFGISKAESLENNTAKITLSIPEDTENLPLKEDSFILSFGGTFTEGYGFDDTRGLHEYAKSKEWNKDSGIQALIVKFNGGEEYLEATLFFDSNEGFKEVMTLLRGSADFIEPVKLDSGQYAHALYLDSSSIEHLENSEHIINVIPSPYR